MSDSSVSARQVAEFLKAQGLPVPEEVTAAIQNEKADEAYHKIVSVLATDKATEQEKQGTRMQKILFGLASDVHKQFKSEVRNQQGRGNAQVEVSQVTIETEDGTLLVKLSRPHKPAPAEK